MTERDIFLALLDLPDSATRVAYLDVVCAADTALRGRLEALLRSHDTAGSFLATPAVAPAPLDTLLTHPLSVQADHAEREPIISFLSPSCRPGSLGRLGHYEVLEILGRGGFGIVFRAYDEVLQRVVALKVLAPHLAVTSPARKRFLREARSSAKVRHEHVVRVYGVEEQPLPYLVMEFIPGETLQQRMERTGPLEVQEVVQVGLQIAEGLAAAHATGLVHRDIKPGNILLESGVVPRARITDFGLARAADDASLTHSGVLTGTPMFMSPEQASGEPVDERADLFSLGSVLYTMCTGRPPFRARGTLAVLKRVAEDNPRPIQEMTPEVPQWLCDIITRLHAKKPEERFSSAREVADLLARCLAELQQHGDVHSLASTKTPVLRSSPTPRRVRVFAIVILLLLGLGLGEAAGVSDVRGTVIRLFALEGTLIVEVEDPGVSVNIDGEELVITGTGAREIRLKPGRYKVRANKDGMPLREELVTVERNGKRIVRISRQATPVEKTREAAREKLAPEDAARWEQAVARLPAEEQVQAVAARLKRLNPGFDGMVTPTIKDGVVIGVRFSSSAVTELSPVRALHGLRSLFCAGMEGKGNLADLAPLRGMKLTTFACNNTQVADLTPLRGMPLKELAFQHTQVSTLTALRDMPLEHLNCSHTGVADLTPLKGKKLITLYLDSTKVTDLSPLRGMPLRLLNCRCITLDPVRDRAVLRSLDALEEINSEPVRAFLEHLDRKP